MLKYLQRTVVTNPNADLDTRRDIVGPLLDDLVCRVTEKAVSNGAGLNTVNRKYKADWEKKYEWLMFERGRKLNLVTSLCKLTVLFRFIRTLWIYRLYVGLEL